MHTTKKRIIKLTLFSVALIAITGGFAGYKMWTKPHRNVEAAKAVNTTALQLAGAYEANETSANTQYLDKVLAVSGTVSEVAKNQKEEPVITLKGTDMSGVICTLEGTAPAILKAGETITVKGICTGYLTDVVLVR